MKGSRFRKLLWGILIVVGIIVMTPKSWTHKVTTLGDLDKGCLFGEPLRLELNRGQISQ
jgi:hypothetical protein